MEADPHLVFMPRDSFMPATLYLVALRCLFEAIATRRAVALAVDLRVCLFDLIVHERVCSPLIVCRLPSADMARTACFIDQVIQPATVETLCKFEKLNPNI